MYGNAKKGLIMIERIKWKNHNILGNLELDFTKEDGTAYNTIVIAGENGVGKTTILDTLATFLSGGAITPFDYIIYDINTIKLKVYYESDAKGYHSLGFHRRHNIKTGEVVSINSNRNNDYDHMMDDQLDIRSYGVVYSKARSGFKTNQVKSTTTMQLDTDKGSIDENENFTEIKQLLIDISSQDNSDLSNIAKDQNRVSPEQYELFKKNSRIYRFEKAFNSFFDNIQFDRIDEQNSKEKTILFNIYGKSVPVDSLSTGEKQIVFRGSYLLKNQRSIKNGVVLIDEPELSMHPLWQERILKYYRDLFKTDANLFENEKQNVQMIVATHSEYVIKSALEDKENVLVIALKNDNGKIEGHPVVTPTTLPTITLAETNYNTFNIVSTDYHIQLYGHLQEITGKNSISECDKYIEEYTNKNNKNKSLYIKPTSHTGKNGKVINYQTLSTLIRNAIDHPDNGNKFNDKDLRASIELLIEIIKFIK